MSHPSDLLRLENLRLRQEIQHFQRVLRETTNTPRCVATWRLDQSKKQALAIDIEKKLERGVFSPPKVARFGTRRESVGGKRVKSKNRKRASKVTPTRRCNDLHHELSTDLTRIETSLDAIQAQNPSLKPALKHEIAALRESLGALLHTRNGRTMKDSFESYYNSERENLETRGRPELSFEQYEKEHLKGERRLNRTLAEQIRKLQSENERLKNRLAETTGRGNSSRGRTLPGRKSSSQSKLRAHCRSCDFLLSRGLSTTRCTKHVPERENLFQKANRTFSP